MGKAPKILLSIKEMFLILLEKRLLGSDWFCLAVEKHETDYPLDDEEAIGFDRESSSRQSFSEKRKQASMSPPLTEKLIEYRSLNRKKSSHGNFIELTI